jgi:hypothetical protein
VQTPEHFVDKIESLPSHAIPRCDLAVFLTTPSFASWLLDDAVFLEKALAKLYKALPASTPVHAVCAVVDRLPQPHHTRSADDQNPIQAEVARRATHPPVNDTGVEGIAYLALPHQAILSAQPTLHGEHGCIDFLTRTKATGHGTHHNRVRVPLANTVFQTGLPSTMITSSWSPSSSAKLERTSREPLNTLAINLSAPRYYDLPTLSIPLVPLTSPRKVHGHMGNIVRALVDAHGNKMTASTELEQAVPRYFKTRGEPPQATSAWALVARGRPARRLVLLQENQLDSPESEETDSDQPQALERLWSANPPQWDRRIQHAFLRGGRLHKVLSGGGGWGKKAGLLSLDPMPIGPPQAAQAANIDDDYETVNDFSMALKPVVRDGDYIQFFVSPAVAQEPHTTVHSFLEQEDTPSASAETKVWSWEFGVIPSTIDAIPSNSPQNTPEAPGHITVHRGTFGALTEGGLTLMRGTNMDRKTGIAKKDLNTTTIDVPFARWSALRLAPKEGVRFQAVAKLPASEKSHKPVKKLVLRKDRFDASHS